MNKTHPGQRFLLLLLAGSAILAFYMFWPFFTPVVFALVLSVTLQPIYKRILRLLGNWPSTAALLTVLGAALCILIPLSLLGTHLAREAQQVYVSFADGDSKAQIQQVILYVERTLVHVPGVQSYADTVSQNISVYGQQALQWAIAHTGSLFSGAASIFLNLFIFFVALYYLLRDGAKLKEALIKLSPLPDSYDETAFSRVGLAVHSVITGSLLVSLIQGVLTAIGFTLFGISNGVLWGTVAALAALVPGVGTSLVFIPAIIFLFVTSSGQMALGLAIWGMLAVGMIDNFIGPRLMGRGIQLHPFFVLLSVLGGISFFGIMGVFLGPILLSFLFALLSMYTSIPKE